MDFFRLGELILKPSQSPTRLLQRDDVSFSFDNGHMSGVQLILRHFKNNKHNKPTTLFLPPLPTNQSEMCPVLTLQAYFIFFKHTAGPLFQFADNSPVTDKFVSVNLQNAVRFIGLNPTQYKGHSFRIGAATQAIAQGHSEQYVQKLGRWHSNAFQRYIRLNAFHL